MKISNKIKRFIKKLYVNINLYEFEIYNIGNEFIIIKICKFLQDKTGKKLRI